MGVYRVTEVTMPLTSLFSFLRSGGDGLADEQQAAVGPGQSALDQEQPLGGIHFHQRMISGGDLVIAHVAGHSQAVLGLAALTSPSGMGRDRTGRAMLTFGAVRSALAAEVVSLHNAGETLALAG